jgi:hypothetical protein
MGSYNFRNSLSREFLSFFFKNIIKLLLKCWCGNLFLTLVSWTDQSDQWCSTLVTVLARNAYALQTMTEQFQLCELGHCRLWKLHRSEIKHASWDALDYPTCPSASFKRMPRYRCPNHHKTNHCFCVGTRHSALRSPDVNSSWCGE